MNRREFSKDMLVTLTGIALIETLFRYRLLGALVRENSNRWLKELNTFCADLKTDKIPPVEWQKQIDTFHSSLPLPDLLKLIDFDKAISHFEYPDLGVVTNDIRFPHIEGMENFSFIGRVFGMSRDRAIIPHGHRNMASCHRVLKGELLLRQYDRVKDDGDYMFIKQTIEQQNRPGDFSSISDDKDNVHWLVAESPKAYTFDVIVVDLHEKPTEIDNIDISGAAKDGDLLRVKKMFWRDALNKYGKSHH